MLIADFVWLPRATSSSLLLKNLIDVYANVLPTLGVESLVRSIVSRYAWKGVG
jgi:hypothetical protein